MHPFASLLAVQDMQSSAHRRAERDRTELARRPDAAALPAPVQAARHARLPRLVRSLVTRRAAG